MKKKSNGKKCNVGNSSIYIYTHTHLQMESKGVLYTQQYSDQHENHSISVTQKKNCTKIIDNIQRSGCVLLANGKCNENRGNIRCAICIE